MAPQGPLFSIITPVYNPPRQAFDLCVQSVLNQSFQNWEWCLVDDAGSESHYVEQLNALARADSRIKVRQRKKNGGIVAASNDAAAMAVGEFLCLLDHDDSLAQEALNEVAKVLTNLDEIDYVYTDEDKVDIDGHFYDVFLKPDWSPERLRSQNYCCHLSVIRRNLFEEVKGFRNGFEGSQDYDLILRITERARRIHHLPQVLYHWRAIEGSTANSAEEKPYAYVAAQRAVQEHLERTGINGVVESAGFGYHRIRRNSESQPLVSVVIPTKGAAKLVRGSTKPLVLRAVDSILENLNYYNHIELVVVADTTTPAEVRAELETRPHTRVVDYSKPFNFSDKCNEGVVESTGEVIVLLNDDTEVITGDWLTTLIPLALESDVGIVGPLLLLEDGRIQSACHSNTPSPHNFRAGFSAESPGDFGMLAVSRECSGLTGAAMALRKSVYFEAGGMCTDLSNCFNDVDFCFKVLSLGYRVVWTPHAKLFHYESMTRDASVPDHELDFVQRRWGRYFDNDRFTRIN